VLPCDALAFPWRRIGEGHVGARLQPGRGPSIVERLTCPANECTRTTVGWAHQRRESRRRNRS